MSHFYGSMQGSRGLTTRCGTANSGMTVHVRGWDFGVEVDVFEDGNTGEDMARVYLTGGSNGSGRQYLGTFSTKDLEAKQ